MIQEYNQNLKSNIRIMQIEITKEYIFYQVGATMLYGSFQQSYFILFLPPISTFNTLMAVAELSNILLQPYTSFYGCVRTTRM